MATLSEIESYQNVIDGLSAVAFAQIKTLLLTVDDPNPIVFRDALLDAYPELLLPFTDSAAQVSAQWYMELREGTGITSPFTPVLAASPPKEQLDAGVRYALSPVFQPQRFIGSDVLSMLAGFTQRMIADAGRDTISGSTAVETRRTYYQRVPRAGCCAFCGLLASRGAAYRSASSAGAVQGRGVDASDTAGKAGGQGKGVQARGSQAIGDRFHDFCRCVVAPKFYDADNDYLDYVEKYFSDQYGDVAAENGNNARDLKLTLANWRKEFGTK